MNEQTVETPPCSTASGGSAADGYHCLDAGIPFGDYRDLPDGVRLDVMAELRNHFGLGPRSCRDCGELFYVPPYMECKNWSLCWPCGSKRFLVWANTEEGRQEIEKARLRLNPPNKD